MIQDQQQLLHMIAAGTVNARDGVQLLRTLKTPPVVITNSNDYQQQPVHKSSPQHNLSGAQLPWLYIQVPVSNR